VLRRLGSHWKLLLLVTIVAAVATPLFDPKYNSLQTAHDAIAFRHALQHPARAIAATTCDVVFAAGYGLLGLVGLWAIEAHGVAKQFATVVIAAAALFDELENLLLTSNVVRRRTITNGWIYAMRVPGTLKWIGSPVLLVVLIAVVRRAIRSGRNPASVSG
jgi:hypothetical protein